ncbi:MAG TPA: hypothetical protein VGD17_17910 [Chitinophagaceae bacterium]
MKIAYIVYRDNGPFSFADQEHEQMLQFLRDKGLDAHEEAWANESVNWQEYECVILKSPWDYVEKPEAFFNWLQKMRELNILLLNSAEIVEWNSDKHYLQEIEKAGLNTIPTAFLERGSAFVPNVHFDAFHTGELIVKPCISGASKNTFKITWRDTTIAPAINQLLQKEAMMVQPFMPEVNEEGEWSLLFFNGKFSHALLKTPLKEDFRSQPQFGADIKGLRPSKKLLAEATAYVTEFAKGCLYARVDGLVLNENFHLMELELIDPYLFLSTYPEGYQNYYEALVELITANRHQPKRRSGHVLSK